MNTRRHKDPAAITLGSRGGKAGTGASKRRGDADFYRRLVARRADRAAGGTSMAHRHLVHNDFTLAAIDDVIGRGQLPAWKALRRALLTRPEIHAKVVRVCAAHLADSNAQRYHFWRHYAEAHQSAA